MNRLRYSPKALIESMVTWILLGCTVAFVFACLENYGRLRNSPAVTRTFKNFEVKDGYNYYYLGFVGSPDALVGIREDVTLESNRWTPVDFSSVSMQSLVDRVGRNNSTGRRGAVILDPAGEPIGIWFSTVSSSSVTVRMAGDRRIASISFQAPIRRRGFDSL